MLVKGLGLSPNGKKNKDSRLRRFPAVLGRRRRRRYSRLLPGNIHACHPQTVNLEVDITRVTLNARCIPGRDLWGVCLIIIIPLWGRRAAEEESLL